MTTQRYRDERPLILRLVLVGLVAALGLSWPNRNDVETMTRAAERWLNARLAEWDPDTTSDPGAYVLVVEPTERREPVVEQAAAEPAVTTERRDSVAAIEPAEMVSTSSLETESARDEQFAEVLGETVALFKEDELTHVLPSDVGLVVQDDEVEAMASPPSLESLVIVPPSAPAALAGDEPTPLAALDLPAVEPLAEVPSVPEVGDALDLAFDGVQNEMLDRFARDAEVLAQRQEPSQVQPLAPDEARETGAGEAVALDGTEDDAPPSGPAETAGMRESRLTNAVRLTREAMVAWASLLHGPAVVTISR